MTSVKGVRCANDVDVDWFHRNVNHVSPTVDRYNAARRADSGVPRDSVAELSKPVFQTVPAFTAIRTVSSVRLANFLLTVAWPWGVEPTPCWLLGTAVGRRSLAGELSLSCTRPVADGRPLMWVNGPL